MVLNNIKCETTNIKGTVWLMLLLGYVLGAQKETKTAQN